MTEAHHHARRRVADERGERHRPGRRREHLGARRGSEKGSLSWATGYTDGITDYDVDGDGLLDMLAARNEGHTTPHEFGWVTSSRLREGGYQSILDMRPSV
jgi:hypothetical protein